MSSIMQFLRMKNLFGLPDQSVVGNDLPDMGGITGNQPMTDDYGNMAVIPPMAGPTAPRVNPAIAQDPRGYDAGQRMRDLYQPETMASDKFNAMVNNYPNREDYHPSMLRKIGGALTAVGSSFGGPANHRFQFNPEGIGMGMASVDKPFTDKLTDWKNQIGPAQTAANMERQSNINERSMAYQTVAQELRQHAQDAKNANDQKKLEISESRAKVYEFKAHNPGAKFDFSGPTVKVANPITGEVTDTGIDTGHMSKLDQMNLSQEFTEKNIGLRGDETRKTEETKQTGRETLEDKRATNREVLKGIPGGNNAGGKPESPSQTRVRQFNAARQLANTDPELRQFIKIGSPGSSDFQVTAPSEGFFGHRGPTAEQYKKITDAIYGNTAMAPAVSHGPTNTPAVPQNGPNVGKETPKTGGVEGPRVKVADKNGKIIGTIPAEQAGQLDKKLYQVVQ